MSNESDEDFLSRWSRRKRAAVVEPRPVEHEPAPASEPVPPSSAVVEPEEAATDFDLASLPPLDAINATTNVAAFLRKEVPLELSRAALRRAWTADPLIRDFVGLAENAWDFNDPNAMPGFGPLDCSPQQLKDMLARVMGESRPESEPDADAPEAGLASTPADNAQEPQQEIRPEPPQDDSSQTNEAAESVDEPSSPNELPSSDVLASRSVADDIAPRHAASAENPDKQAEMAITEEETQVVQRTHGGALPR